MRWWGSVLGGLCGKAHEMTFRAGLCLQHMGQTVISTFGCFLGAWCGLLSPPASLQRLGAAHKPGMYKGAPAKGCPWL